MKVSLNGRLARGDGGRLLPPCPPLRGDNRGENKIEELSYLVDSRTDKMMILWLTPIAQKTTPGIPSGTNSPVSLCSRDERLAPSAPSQRT